MLPPQNASDDPDQPGGAANPELYGRLDIGKILPWLILGVLIIYIAGLFVVRAQSALSALSRGK